MDEAVAGHASRIEVTLEPGNRLTIVDNGRGMPVDPHPKFPDKSALEVIMRSEEHTSELQSLMRISYAVFCLKKKKTKHTLNNHYTKTTTTETIPNYKKTNTL